MRRVGSLLFENETPHRRRQRRESISGPSWMGLIRLTIGSEHSKIEKQIMTCVSLTMMSSTWWREHATAMATDNANISSTMISLDVMAGFVWLSVESQIKLPDSWPVKERYVSIWYQVIEFIYQLSCTSDPASSRSRTTWCSMRDKLVIVNNIYGLKTNIKAMVSIDAQQIDQGRRNPPVDLMTKSRHHWIWRKHSRSRS